jgi:hypothetical protein
MMQALLALFGATPAAELRQHHDLSQQLAVATQRLENAANGVVERANKNEEPLTKLARDMKARKRKAPR